MGNDLRGSNFLDALDGIHLQWFAEGDAGDGGEPAPESSGGEQGGGDPSPESEAPKEQTWLPKDLRGHEKLGGFTGAGELANAYLEAASKTEGAVVPPGEDATDEQITEFYRRIGHPEQPSEYELAEGVDTEEDEEWFRQIAHKAKLTKGQARDLYNEYAARIKETTEAQAKARADAAAKAEETLKNEWGEQYESRLGKAQGLVKQLAGEEFISYLNESGLGNDVRLIKAMDKFASLISEDSLVLGDGPTATMTEAERLAKLYPKSVKK